MRKWKYAIALVCSFQLIGCTSIGFRSRIAGYTGNSPEISSADVKRFVTRQNAVLAEFASLAGVVDPGPSGEWRPVIDAGIHYSDVRCDRFMDSLFWFNRVRETTSRQLQYTGAAASAALSVVKASVTAIGLTPLGFNFLDQTVNNFGAGLLFNLNPSNVRTIVERRQLAFRQGLSGSYTSRALALQIIQDYAAICLPPSIETEVEQAIATQQYVAKPVAPALPPSADDQVPDMVGFSDRENVPPNTRVESAWATLTGTGASTRISVSQNAEYKIIEDGLERDWTKADGTIKPLSKYKIALTSSSKNDDKTTAQLTIGGVVGSFTVRTQKAAAGAARAIAVPLADSQPLVITDEQNVTPNPQPVP